MKKHTRVTKHSARQNWQRNKVVGCFGTQLAEVWMAHLIRTEKNEEITNN